MPELNGLLEAALYVEDVERARQFYQDVLDLDCLHASQDGAVFAIARRQMLLISSETKARIPSTLADGQEIPVVLDRPGPARGAGHVAFAIDRDELDDWRARLSDRDVTIEAEVEFERGGISLYFRDPDGHLLELATPGIWEIY